MSSSLIGRPIHSALCHIKAKRFVNYIFYLCVRPLTSEPIFINVTSFLLVRDGVNNHTPFCSSGGEICVDLKEFFFPAAVVSILLYGYITWTLTKRVEKKLDVNYTRMLRAIVNESWRQRPQKIQLYGHLQPITKTMYMFRRTRHAGHSLRSRDELKSMDEQRQDDQLEPIYSSSVPIRDVVLKTCRKRWTIDRGGEKGLGRFVLRARPDADDDLDKCNAIFVRI